MLVKSRRCPDSVRVLALALAVFACGKGSRDEKPPAPGELQVLLRDGDVLPGGFEITTIESAKMATDRSVAFIASQSGVDAPGGVFVRAPGGSTRPVLTPTVGDSGGLALTVVRNLVMAAGGEFGFEVGDQIDADGFFVFDGTALHTAAHTSGAGQPESFRVLGEARLSAGGAVVFSAGQGPCEVDSSTGTERITCDLGLYGGLPGEIRPIAVPNTLLAQRPTAITVQANGSGLFAVGLPARGSEPLVGLVQAGEFSGVLSRQQDLAELGVLLSAKPRAVSESGGVAIDGSFDLDGDEERDLGRALLLEADGRLSAIAESTGSFEGQPIQDVRARDIDDSNRVLYSFSFGEGEPRMAIRVWAAGQTSEVAHEGRPFGEDDTGKPIRILEIDQMRMTRAGDVLFVALLGSVEEGTRRISQTALIRWRTGRLEKVLRTRSTVEGRTLVGLSIADVNSVGDLLLIGEIERRATRALLLLPAG